MTQPITALKNRFRGNAQVQAVLLFILLFFAVFVLYPAAVIFSRACSADIAKILTKQALGTAFAHSITVSALSAFITTLLAFILAYTGNFTNVPVRIKKIIRTLAVFPMLLPTITYGFAVIYSFGRQGLMTKLAGRQFFDFYGFGGLTFCYIIYTLPISFMLLNNTMSYIDKRYLIVTRVMGDNSAASFRTAILQPLWGTLAVSFVQSFFLSFTDFGIPASIGGRYTVIAELLYNVMLGSLPDFSSGAVIALLMLLPSVASILLLNYLQRFNVRYTKQTAVELRRSPARDTIYTALSAVILAGELSIFPVIFIVPFTGEWPYAMQFTLSHIISVFNDRALITVFTNSVTVSVFTAAAGTAFVYAAALVTARSTIHPHGRLLIESIAQITNAVPGMVLGIAFLLAFRKTPLHNTAVILICCNLIHFFATPYLMMKSTLDKMNASWETTACLLGDTWIKTVIRIITPNAARTLLEVFCYFFINGMVTVSAIVFLAGARTMVITTKIQELQHFAKFNEIFILSLLILITNLSIKGIKGCLNRTRGSVPQK